MTDRKSPSDETGQDRLTRNLNELLQELRVTQTGAQILSGFLLTLPFSSRFGDLDDVQRRVYLVVFAGSVLTTMLIVSPVAIHRTLFRQGEREFLVEAANQLARAGLVCLALTISGVVWLIFDVVTIRTSAFIASGATLVSFAVLWAGLPIFGRRR